jgi:diguanylate cyclase (GGDEF)-like protein
MGFGAINAPLPEPVEARTGRLAPPDQAVTHPSSPGPALPRPDVISRIERVVPLWVWVGLGGALLIAVVSAGSALWSGARVRRQNRRVAEITAAALTDPLTSLLNRRGFLHEAERELARAYRHERPFTLAYADVRGLKAVNDTLGHDTGDRLLRSVARLLRETARAGDAVGRLGGDELGLLLVEQSADGAAAVAMRIQAAISVHRRSLALGIPWDLTIGLATYPEDGTSIAALLQRADERLYAQRGITVRSR